MNIRQIAVLIGLVTMAANGFAAGDPLLEPVWETQQFKLTFASDGHPASFFYKPLGRELLDRDNPGSGLFLAEIAGAPMTLSPAVTRLSRLSRTKEGDLLAMTANGTRSVRFKVGQQDSHLTFRIVELKGFPQAEQSRLCFELRLGFTGRTGAAVTTVRGAGVAAGIQSLDYMTFSTISSAGKSTILGVDWSYLWHRSPDDPLGGFALFACREEEALETIGKIEVSEGLPHPVLEGQWAKLNNWPSRLAQMCFYFKAEETEEAIGYLERAGIKMCYLLQGLWQGPGIFTVRKQQFREGEKGLQEFSERLRSKGILLGLHTGSAGIFMGDPVLGSPVPDPRLAGWGTGRLAADVDAKAPELEFIPDPGVELPYISSQVYGIRPPAYNLTWSYDYVQVGREVIKVGSFENTSGDRWVLRGCRRGANSSAVAAHPAGERAKGLLVSYGSCFAPDINTPLFNEMADALAGLVNRCSIARISFDALEMADYPGRWAMVKWMQRVYQGFDHAVAGESSSGVPQYEWHISSYANTGEGMFTMPRGYFETYLRGNVRHAQDNFLPPALGTYAFRLEAVEHKATTPDEWEWWLAKTAAYDACYFFESTLDHFRKHGQTERILELTGKWEAARLAGVFSPEQRRAMENFDLTFHLSESDPSAAKWAVRPVRINTDYTRADGGSVQATNPFSKQPLGFELHAMAAFNREDERNIPLLPEDPRVLQVPSYLKLEMLDGTPVQARIAQAIDTGRKSKGDDDFDYIDYLAQMGTGTTGLRTNTSGAGVTNEIVRRRAMSGLTLSYENRSEKSASAIQAEWRFAKPVDFSQHRGVGLWVTGDGQGGWLYVQLKDNRWGMRRSYFIPNDRKGRRWVEIPTGEIGSQHYDLWDRYGAGDLGTSVPWLSIKLGFEYQRIASVAFGLLGVPAHTTVRCTIESPVALREINTPLQRPTLSLGNQKLTVEGDLPPGHYLAYEGGSKATVMDANRHPVGTLHVKGHLTMPAQKLSPIKLDSAGDGTRPWVRVEAKTQGEDFSVDNPYQTIRYQKLMDNIRRSTASGESAGAGPSGR